MPSFKYPTRGYSGGWQGPGSMLYTYSGGWQVPDNAFYSNGAGGWVRFFGDNIAFGHGTLELRGIGYDEVQGGEGGDPFNIHFYGSASYTLNTDGTVRYDADGAVGSGPDGNSTWAEAGIDSSKYEVNFSAYPGAESTWFNLGSQVTFAAGGPEFGQTGYWNGTLSIRHAASGNIFSTVNLIMNTD